MTATLERIVTEFDSLSSKDKLKALSILKKHYYKNEFSKIKDKMPDVKISKDEIMKEVKAVRNGKTKIQTPKNL